LINTICDNALLGGYVAGVRVIKPSIVKQAIKESLPSKPSGYYASRKAIIITGSVVIGVILFVGVKMGELNFLWTGRDVSIYKNSSGYEVNSEILVPSVTKIDDAMFGFFKNIGQDVEDTDERNYILEQRTKDEQDSHYILPSDLEAVTKEIDVTRGVKPQEALLKIIVEVYGKSNETLLDIVQRYNPSIKNINFIYAGQKIVFPKLTPESLIFKSGDGRYFVHYYSTSQADKATKKLKEISSFNYQASIVAVDSSDRITYRVYVGPFGDLNYAKEALLSLPHDHLPIGFEKRIGN
jgi:hypothetical protein